MRDACAQFGAMFRSLELAAFKLGGVLAFTKRSLHIGTPSAPSFCCLDIALHLGQGRTGMSRGRLSGVPRSALPAAVVKGVEVGKSGWAPDKALI